MHSENIWVAKPQPQSCSASAYFFEADAELVVIFSFQFGIISLFSFWFVWYNRVRSEFQIPCPGYLQPAIVQRQSSVSCCFGISKAGPYSHYRDDIAFLQQHFPSACVRCAHWLVEPIGEKNPFQHPQVSNQPSADLCIPVEQQHVYGMMAHAAGSGTSAPIWRDAAESDTTSSLCGQRQCKRLLRLKQLYSKLQHPVSEVWTLEVLRYCFIYFLHS